jgi:AcrR family transcriptional regulator
MRTCPETQRVNPSKSDASARDGLLAAASNLMIELGTSDVSLHAIARRAGVTAPLVKYYFGSKEGLLIALVERDTARSLAQLRTLVDNDIDPVEKLRHHITGIIRTYSRYPYLSGLLSKLLRESETDTGQIKRNFIEPLIESQRAIIEAGIRGGQFRAVDPDKAYFVIAGACQYLFATRVSFIDLMNGALKDEAFVRDFSSVAVDLILNGISK